MSAFSSNNAYQIRNNIRALMQRRLSVGKLMLTSDEYIDTFVPVAARQLFRDITPYNGVEQYIHAPLHLTQFGGVGKATLYISHERHRPHPPLVKDLMVQPDAPAEVITRIKTWLENGGDVYHDWGRVAFVFEELNRGWGKGALRYYWPSIQALCDFDNTRHLLADLGSGRAPPALKPLPAGLPQLIRLTAATIATAKLIPDETRPAEFGEVTIEPTPNQTYEEHGFQFYGSV